MKGYPLVAGETPQSTVASEQRPTALLCNGECKGVGRRELCTRTPYFDGPRKLRRGQVFDSHAERDELVAERPLEFTVEKQIRNRKFIRQPKQVIEKAASFQIDNHGCIGNEDRQWLHRDLIQTSVEFAHGNAEQFCCPGLSDYLLGQRPIA